MEIGEARLSGSTKYRHKATESECYNDTDMYVPIPMNLISISTYDCLGANGGIWESNIKHGTKRNEATGGDHSRQGKWLSNMLLTD